MGKIRLDRLLANLGYGSRKEVSGAIKRGVLRHGMAVLRDPSAQIDEKIIPELTYDGEALDPPSPLTLILNKPKNNTCSHDEMGLLVYDLLPPRFKHRTPPLSTAGRLDKDSTGLVVLTDDGQLLHKIISPKVHVSKHYRVTLRDELKGDEAATFFSGVFCMAGDTKPLKPALWQATGAKDGIMILQEGRFRQIRRMFETIGNYVEELHRFKIGGLKLENIAEGEYRLCDADDITKIFGEEK